VEKAMIVRADKGKTIVIINTDEYTNKVHILSNRKQLPHLPK
jgi:hypothetical protein